eukprot:gene647-1079_t
MGIIYGHAAPGTWIAGAYGEDWPGYFMMNGTVNSRYLAGSHAELGYRTPTKTYLATTSMTHSEQGSADTTVIEGAMDGVVAGLIRLNSSYDSDYSEFEFDPMVGMDPGTYFTPMHSTIFTQYVDADNDGSPEESYLTYKGEVNYYNTSDLRGHPTTCKLVMVFTLTDVVEDDTNDPACTAAGCPASWQGDQYCDLLCMSPSCGNDNGDCDACLSSGCTLDLVGNSDCDAECASAECSWDGQMCVPSGAGGIDSNEPACTASGCPASWQGDGHCDEGCISVECGHDAGDCGACLATGCTLELLGNDACDLACNSTLCQNDFRQCGGGAGCADDASFTDELGFACHSWAGYDCSLAASLYGYSVQGEALLLASCPVGCGLCAGELSSEIQRSPLEMQRRWT